MDVTTPILNWLEWQTLVQKLNAECRGLFIERVIIPERSRFSQRYLKGEWAFKLSSKTIQKTLVFSVRSRHPYLYLVPGSPLKNASHSTQSAFGLFLSKTFKSLRVHSIYTLPLERVVILEVQSQGQILALVLTMIPAVPEALVVEKTGEQSTWPVLARSRLNSGNDQVAQLFIIPKGANAPQSPEIRAELTALGSYSASIEKNLDEEAFCARKILAERALRDSLKTASTRARQTQATLSEALKDQDWASLGKLLKSNLGSDLPIVREGKQSFRVVTDYANDVQVKIPCDPRLEPSAQASKFFQLAKRKQRRIFEAQTRIDQMNEAVHRLTQSLGASRTDLNWPALERMERAAGIITNIATNIAATIAGTGPKQKSSSKRGGAWLGKTFLSGEGATIWIGRSKDENLELTFKHARGNDVWLHVRGKPGAHGLVPLTSGKSASLDTLIDAATLVIYYSGGEKWGKTEVDYTFKKYVKRIKDSSEASYTHNKTLSVEPDAGRLKRLLGQQNE